jgi:putative DNA primase/helicase
MDDVELICAADVGMKPVDWLWHGWLAKGELHLLVGNPGVGKTTLALTMAAIVSRGALWPDGSRCESAGDVVIWSEPDDPESILIPRLMAAGANLSRIHFITDVEDADGKVCRFNPEKDVQLLARALTRIRPALLILDPIVYAVSVSENINKKVRRALQPLAEMADRMACAVLGISYLSKGAKRRDLIERVIGSVSFATLASVVMMAIKADSPGHSDPPRLLVRSKSKFGPAGDVIGYDFKQIEVGMEGLTTHIDWHGYVGCADELADPVAQRAMRLYRWLLEREAPLRPGDILRLGPAALRSKSRRDAALERLEADGLVTLTQGVVEVIRAPYHLRERPPAKIAKAAKTRVNTSDPGCERFAKGCERPADPVPPIREHSQAIRNAESKQPCGCSQDSQLSQTPGATVAKPAPTDPDREAF